MMMFVSVHRLVLAAPLALVACAHTDPSMLACSRSPIDGPPTPSEVYRDNTIADLQSLASAGNLPAARVLGERYEHGDGVAPDLKRAADWYDKAAVIPPSTTFVSAPAVGKLPGFLVPVSGGRASPGDPIAMAELGQLYLTGRGVSADPTRARILLACASSFGIGTEFHLVDPGREG